MLEGDKGKRDGKETKETEHILPGIYLRLYFQY